MAYIYNKFLTVDSSGNVSLTSSPNVGDSSNKIATTSFVAAAVNNYYNPANVNINGGSINNVTVGASTPSTGSFTSASFSGTLNLSSATVSGTTTLLGALIETTRLVTAATNPIVVTATDVIIAVAKTVGAATTISLPSGQLIGRRLVIKDSKGDAATNNITISPPTGVTIDGGSALVISTNYGLAELVFNGTNWSSLTYTSLTANVVESVEGFTVTTAGPIVYASKTTGQASIGPFNQFSLVTSTTTPPFVISMNGTQNGANVVALKYHNHACYQHATDNSTFDGWWYWLTSLAPPGWQFFGINSLTFTDGTTTATYAANAPANTVLGTLSIPMSDGSTFTGTITLSDNTNFKMVGLQLEAKVQLTVSSYQLTITATPSVVGNSSGAITFNINQQSAAVSYGTTAPASLPNTTGAVSPLGWQVDMFDDFTGTMTRFSNPNWAARTDIGPQNCFTTGATYNGQLIQYGALENEEYGGYSIGQVDDIRNVTMSNSALHFACNYNTYGDGKPHTASVVIANPSAWGLWEMSFRNASAANGNNSQGVGNAVWLSNNAWPTAGEFDLNETGWGNAVGTTIHLSPTASVDGPVPPGRGLSVYSTNTYPGTGGTFDDGRYHTYAALITPAYMAFYFDGTRQWTTTNGAYGGYTLLSNISTASNPPTAASPGSFGYGADQFGIAGNSGPTNLTWMGQQSYWFIGINLVDQPTTGTYDINQLPMTAHCDWIRHSVLFPASGGPHV